MSFLSTKSRRVARIFVRLDVRDGLFENVEISFEGKSHLQNLDYEEFSFRCWHCHKLGNMETNYPLGFRGKRRHNQVRLEDGGVWGVGNDFRLRWKTMILHQLFKLIRGKFRMIQSII